jgi:hypothetical protein
VVVVVQAQRPAQAHAAMAVQAVQALSLARRLHLGRAAAAREAASAQV